MASRSDLSEFEEIEDAAELRRQIAVLERRLRRAKDRTEEMRDAVREGMHDALRALGPLRPVKAPKRDPRKKKAEVALWHLTDWQGAKVTTSYNSDVMRERVLRFCDTAAQLTEIQRADHPVDECLICFGGDMGEGLFNYPAQPFEVDQTIFGQYTFTARVEAEVVRRALAIYSRVRVLCEWGNHGRIGTRRSAVPRPDNFDRMAYELASAQLAGEDRLLSFENGETDIQHIEIGNYRALLIHGDEWGAQGSVSPATMVKRVNDWKAGGHDWPFRDCYMGHYHQHAEHSLADGDGAIYRTASPESDNRYASDGLAARGGSTQRLHFIDPKAGRVTSQHKVYLR